MDLSAYLARIGISSAPDPSVEGLHRVQRAHRLTIPFESLDVQLGRGISVESQAIFAKLVTQRRGGYCFEQNQLLGRALKALGLSNRALLGRVWLFATAMPPRTHTLRLAMVEGEQWIADGGFGASYCPPMRLLDGESVVGPDGTIHRLISHPEHGWMLERQTKSGFVPQFSFTLDTVADLDIAMSNHWTSTWSGSRFVQNVIVSIVTPNGMTSLMNRILTRQDGHSVVESELANRAEMRSCLNEEFGISFSLDEVEALGLF